MNAYFRWLCACMLMVVACGAEAFTPPALNGKRINDYAHILQPAELGSIEQTLAQYEAKTAHQIAVLTVSSLQGETIESFANATFKSWRLGHKGKDDGVLLLISVGEKNTARIEVGYGLEGVLPDITCGSIIRNDIRPEFKQKHYAAAIVAGITAMEKAIGGQYKVVAAAPSSSNSLTMEQLSAIGIGIVGLVITIILCCIQRVLGGVGGAISAFIAINVLLSSLGWAIAAAILGFFIGMIARDILEGVTYASFGGGGSSSDSFSGGGGTSGGGGGSGSLD